MIYLDYSATTPPYEEVLETVMKVSRLFFANPSSLHRLGAEAERLLSECRRQAALLLNVNAEEIIFTSGGSEGNNLAIKGTAERFQSRGKHIITTQVEHPSVLNTCRQLEQSGYIVTYLPVDGKGKIKLNDLRHAIRKDTILVSIIHVNNETGAVQPVKEIGNLLKEYPRLFFHVDHVQGIGKVPIDFKQCGIDLCTLSGHKFHGPKGTGLLYCRNGIELTPLINGGGQENGKRSGTENLAGVAGMVKALRITLENGRVKREMIKNTFTRLRNCVSNLSGITIHTPQKDAAPHILNVSLHGVLAEVLIHALEKEEIYISTKSACSSKQSEPSKVLTAMGVSDKEALEAVRISLSFDTTTDEIDKFCRVLETTKNQLLKVMR